MAEGTSDSLAEELGRPGGWLMIVRGNRDNKHACARQWSLFPSLVTPTVIDGSD